MATNEVFKPGWQLSVACSHPTTPASGDPVRYGSMTGIALTAEDADGNTSVDFGPVVATLTVDDDLGSGIAVGDSLYYHDTATGSPAVRVNNNPTAGYFFGVALATVSANATTSIRVKHVDYPGIIPANSLDGSSVASNANANVVGTPTLLYRIDIAAGALGNTDVVVTHKIRVIDAHLVLCGAGVSSTTLQVKNGATAITNAMAASGSDQALVRAATIDDAAHEIAAGGTLRVTSASGATQPDAVVYVLAVRVP